MLDTVYGRCWHIRQWVPASLMVFPELDQARGHEQQRAQLDVVEQTNSRLLSLLGETRSLIWHFGTQRLGIPTCMDGEGLVPVLIPTTTKPDLPHPALLVTCREIRHETLPIYYTANTTSLVFNRVHSLQLAENWLNALTDDALASIPAIVLQGLVKHGGIPMTLAAPPILCLVCGYVSAWTL